MSNTFHTGYAGMPTSPEAHKTIQELLEKDRKLHHCFVNKQRFHNHLSHHLLAVYDLGGSAPLLQAIYDKEEKKLFPIDDSAFAPNGANGHDVTITTANWTQHLGTRELYESYFKFFSKEIKEKGVEEVFKQYLFAKDARMIGRFLAGLFHPLIQTGYGTEFGSHDGVAQGLAQTAVHELMPDQEGLDPEKPSTTSGTPILEIMKQYYESTVIVPGPYDPSFERFATLANPGPGIVDKVRQLAAQWLPSGQLTDADIAAKVEELCWLASLLLVCTNKRGRKHKLDFFIMHIVTSTSFLPSLLKYIPDMENKRELLVSYFTLELMWVLGRGRPKIDCEDTMQYPLAPKFPLDTSKASDAIAASETDPWPAIIQEVVHAPEAHIIKSVRALLAFARRYGHRQAGEITGAAAFPGGGKLDGSLFVRAARVALDVMGWVTMGEKEGAWDFKGIGWDEAWQDVDATKSA